MIKIKSVALLEENETNEKMKQRRLYAEPKCEKQAKQHKNNT